MKVKASVKPISGQLLEDSEQKPSYDFDSKLWLFEAEDE